MSTFKDHRQQTPGALKGFTLLEILVVVAIIALLAAILFPAFARARENARRISCASNLKQLGMAFAQYVQDFDENYPAHYTQNPNADNTYWPTTIGVYSKSAQLLSCPSLSNQACHVATAFPHYGYNADFSPRDSGTSAHFPVSRHVAEINYPAELTVLDENYIASVPSDATQNGCGYYVTWYDYSQPLWNFNIVFPHARHFNGGNVLFADGHVKWLPLDALTIPPTPASKWRLWYVAAP